MRLIDADALKDNMFGYAPPEMTWDRGDIEHKIDEMPTVEPKRGRWERHFSRPNVYADLYWWCTCCGRPTGYVSAFLYDYCPHCGADMREVG